MREAQNVMMRVPQPYLDFVNQIFEIEKKSINLNEENSILRNVNKIKALIEDEFFKGSIMIGLSYHNPIGESYSDTRTDCEATIAGGGVDNLEIIEVIKPIIFYAYRESQIIKKVIVQQAVVIVQQKSEN